MTATVEWQAIAGVTHAWIAQCEGYVSLCGREVSGFGGQRSGIRCAQCTVSSGWADQTGQESYLTPQRPMDMDAMFNMMEKVRGVPRHIGPQRMRRQPKPVEPVPQPGVLVPPPTIGPPREASNLRVAPVPALQAPETVEQYQQLPDVEQRYWAPVMLARAGKDAMWDQAQETAEQFQQRCYEQVSKGT